MRPDRRHLMPPKMRGMRTGRAAQTVLLRNSRAKLKAKRKARRKYGSIRIQTRLETGRPCRTVRNAWGDAKGQPRLCRVRAAQLPCPLDLRWYRRACHE